MDKINRPAEGNSNQLGLFSSEARPKVEEPLFQSKQVVKPRSVIWLDPHILCEHPRNKELFGAERLSDLEDLVLSLSSGYDVGRSIKAVKREDGNIVIVDGHRRNRAAIIVNCPVPVIIQSLKDENEEIEEMIFSNLVRNRNHKPCGIGTAVRVIQMLRPRNAKRGRPTKKIMAQRAGVFDTGENADEKCAQPRVEKSYQANVDDSDTRRAYYAKLLGINEKKFRLVDYVLRHGNEDERRELDYGPRKLSAIHNAVRSRVTGEELKPSGAPRVIARAARAALRAAKSFFALLDNQEYTEEVELAIKSLVKLANDEVKGAEPNGSTARRALTLYRQLVVRNLKDATIAKRNDGRRSKRR